MKNIKKALRGVFYENKRNFHENLSDLEHDVSVSLGARRLFFAQTYHSNEELVKNLGEYDGDEICVAFYVHDPQVVVDLAGGDLYLDSALAYRLVLKNFVPPEHSSSEIGFRFLMEQDLPHINKIYEHYGMFPLEPEITKENHYSRAFSYFVAEKDEEIIGIVIGIDHRELFNSPEGGCSLFGLAVMPGDQGRGVGRRLINHGVDHYTAKGRNYLDLYVDYDNHKAIALYEKMGFEKIPRFSIKREKDRNKIESMDYS